MGENLIRRSNTRGMWNRQRLMQTPANSQKAKRKTIRCFLLDQSSAKLNEKEQHKEADIKEGDPNERCVKLSSTGCFGANEILTQFIH